VEILVGEAEFWKYSPSYKSRLDEKRQLHGIEMLNNNFDKKEMTSVGTA